MKDDTTLTTRETAEFFGIDATVLYTRRRQLPGHPQTFRDERLSRVFWNVGELRAFSKAYHARQSSRCLFSLRRLMELTPEELEAWGVKEKPAA